MASYPPSKSQAAIPDGPGGPDHDQDGALGDPAPAPGHLGWIVAGSLLVGIVAALALVAAPFIRVDEAAITGAVLCGFAIGWAVLAFATGFTARPQWWAVAPAAFMGLGGLLLIVFGESMRAALAWVWPVALLALAIWMVTRIHRRMSSRTGRALLYLVCGVLAISAIGGGYEIVRETTEGHTIPRPGRLIDVGGHKLYLHCTGTGSPTVVLEPGGGEMSANMGWIAPAVARQTRVCVYDRAGRGWSEQADVPQDGAQIAADLHTLLQRAGEHGPYVLAGHSFGGLYTRTFAARYPQQVAGLVLVDSTASRQPAESATPSPPTAGGYDASGRVSALMSIPARLGLARVAGLVGSGDLPVQSRAEYVASTAKAASVRSTIDEYVAAGDSAREAASLRDFADKPLAVLTAGVGNDAAWMQVQNESARLSTNSVHRVVAGAQHEDLVGVQRYARATTQAILSVVAAVRNHEPLPG